MPPASRAEPFATPADLAACRQAIRQGSRSFHLAGKLLPVDTREPAFAIYAFCRHADDLIDRDGGGAAAIESLDRLLDRAYAGRPGPNFVERALAVALRDFAIPRAVPESLVEGLRWDAEGRRYRTVAELRAYAVRVAGSVGVMMSLVMRCREPDVLARACDLGIAMQFTNICRDIGEDARSGRIYLPDDLLSRAGATAADLVGARALTPPLRAVARSLLAEAEAHYERAGAGIAALPAGTRLGINAARLLYREIGRMVGEGVDPIAMRAVVSRRRKLALLLAAANLPRRDTATLAEPVTPEAAYLIDAVSRTPARLHKPLPDWWNVTGRAVHMVEMLARLDGGTRTARPR